MKGSVQGIEPPRRWRRPRARGVVSMLALLLTLCAPLASAQAVEVITSPDLQGQVIDRGLLRALFTMRARQWPDGRPTRVFVLPDNNALHETFCRELLGTYPYVLRSAWDRMVYTGTGFAPTTVGSEAEMRQRVRATPGAVGYAPTGRQSFLPDYLLSANAGPLAGGSQDE